MKRPARILKLTEEARAEALPPGAREDRTGLHTTGIVAERDGHTIALFMTGPVTPGRT